MRVKRRASRRRQRSVLTRPSGRRRRRGRPSSSIDANGISARLSVEWCLRGSRLHGDVLSRRRRRCRGELVCAGVDRGQQNISAGVPVEHRCSDRCRRECVHVFNPAIRCGEGYIAFQHRHIDDLSRVPVEHVVYRDRPRVACSRPASPSLPRAGQRRLAPTQTTRSPTRLPDEFTVSPATPRATSSPPRRPRSTVQAGRAQRRPGQRDHRPRVLIQCVCLIGDDGGYVLAGTVAAPVTATAPPGVVLATPNRPARSTPRAPRCWLRLPTRTPTTARPDGSPASVVYRSLRPSGNPDAARQADRGGQADTPKKTPQDVLATWKARLRAREPGVHVHNQPPQSSADRIKRARTGVGDGHVICHQRERQRHHHHHDS